MEVNLDMSPEEKTNFPHKVGHDQFVCSNFNIFVNLISLAFQV